MPRVSQHRHTHLFVFIDGCRQPLPTYWWLGFLFGAATLVLVKVLSDGDIVFPWLLHGVLLRLLVQEERNI